MNDKKLPDRRFIEGGKKRCVICEYIFQKEDNFFEMHRCLYKEEVLEYSLYKCPECESITAEPMLSAPPDWYAYIGEQYGWRWEFSRFLNDITSLSISEKILEVGCGEGIILQKLKELGFSSVHGIDINENAIKKAKGKGINAYPMRLNDFVRKFPELTFNAIAFFHLLEHLENPYDFLVCVNSILKDRGFIFLSIPNPNRFNLLIKREEWDYTPHKLIRFSQKVIKTLLERTGFRILKIEEEPKGASLLRVIIWKIDSILKRMFGIDAKLHRKLIRYPIKLLFLIFFPILYPHIFLKMIKNYPYKGGQSLYVVAQKDIAYKIR